MSVLSSPVNFKKFIEKDLLSMKELAKKFVFEGRNSTISQRGERKSAVGSGR